MFSLSFSKIETTRGSSVRFFFIKNLHFLDYYFFENLDSDVVDLINFKIDQLKHLYIFFQNKTKKSQFHSPSSFEFSINSSSKEIFYKDLTFSYSKIDLDFLKSFFSSNNFSLDSLD